METTIKIDKDGVWINGKYVDTTPEVEIGAIGKNPTLYLVSLTVLVDESNLSIGPNIPSNAIITHRDLE